MKATNSLEKREGGNFISNTEDSCFVLRVAYPQGLATIYRVLRERSALLEHMMSLI